MLLLPWGTGYGAGTLARAPAGMLARVPAKRLALTVRASATEAVRATAAMIPINAKLAFAITRMSFSFLALKVSYSPREYFTSLCFPRVEFAPRISGGNANLQ